MINYVIQEACLQGQLLADPIPPELEDVRIVSYAYSTYTGMKHMPRVRVIRLQDMLNIEHDAIYRFPGLQAFPSIQTQLEHIGSEWTDSTITNACLTLVIEKLFDELVKKKHLKKVNTNKGYYWRYFQKGLR